MVTLIVNTASTSWTEENNLYAVFYKDKDEITEQIKSYSDFLHVLSLIKDELQDKSVRDPSVFMCWTLGFAQWITLEIAEKMGIAMKDLLGRPYIKLDSGAGKDYYKNIHFKPFVEQIGPALRTLVGSIQELATFEGCFIDNVDLSGCRDSEYQCYLPDLFRINATKYVCGAAMRLHQFYMSRLPCQPNCKKFICTALLDFEISPVFYQNVFHEFAHALPNVKRLRVTCSHRHIYDIKTVGTIIASHIVQFAENAHIPTVLDVKIVNRCVENLAAFKTLIYGILSGQGDLRIKQTPKKDQLIYRHKNTKCFCNFELQVSIGGWYMTDDEEDYSYEFD